MNGKDKENKIDMKQYEYDKIKNYFYDEEFFYKQNKNYNNTNIEITNNMKNYKLKYPNNKLQNYIQNKIEIIELQKNIDLFSKEEESINETEIVKQIKRWKEEYNVILIDIENEIKNHFGIFIDEIDKIIFLTEANILQIKKSKMYLEEMISKYKIEKEKINIVFNKITQETLSLNILKSTLNKYNILGKINDIKNCNLLVNHNMKKIYLNKRIKRQYQKIGYEILKNKNMKNYYLNKLENK